MKKVKVLALADKRKSEISKRDVGEISGEIPILITYMSCLAEAGASRSDIFRLVGEWKDFKWSKHFRQIYLLADRLRYGYAKACNTIAKKISSGVLRETILRFAHALASGESESEFLARERKLVTITYFDKYQRSLETLKTWGEAYSATLISVTFISITVVLSCILYSGFSPSILFRFTVLAMGIVSITGNFLLYRVAPKEKKNHSLEIKPKKQVLIKRLRFPLPILGAFLSLFLFFTGFGLSLALIFFALTIFPLGF
ncbi:hypothetical protein DRO26_03365 [Candidatus Bathyarchaeota archaeon]|nr:MAG: hypothetical protein DRO26_03365 [Candidatus Bathyarchaeota archaeon]